MGRAAGLSAEQIDAIAGDDPGAGPFSPRQVLLLRAVDELHDGDAIGEETFAALREGALRSRSRRALHARRPLLDARGPDQLAADSVGRPPVSGPVARQDRPRHRRRRRDRPRLPRSRRRGAAPALVLTDIQAEPLAATAAEIGDRGGRVLHTEALDLTDHDGGPAPSRRGPSRPRQRSTSS